MLFLLQSQEKINPSTTVSPPVMLKKKWYHIDIMFSADSTLRFSIERGFSESHHVLCPVCWNSDIRIILWEDGSEDVSECATCRRRERMMGESQAREQS
jgi:hypothetical protein